MERFVADLAIKQKRNHHTVEVFTVSGGGSFVGEIASEGIPVHVYEKKTGFDSKYVWALRKEFRRGRFDVIHTHNPFANLYGTLGGKLAGVKKIINTRHGMGNFPFNQRRERIFKLLSYWINAVVFVCLKAQERFETLNLVAPGKSQVIYNGIDLEKFSNLNVLDYSDVREEIGLSGQDKIIGAVARLDPAKDLANLLNALPFVLQSFKNVHLLLVGSGRLLEDLQQQAIRLKIEKNVHFLGERKDIPRLLTAMDMFVLPSITEGMSLTLIEAAACGKPVIATNVGGSPEVIIDQLTGTIVEPGDPIALADAIKNYLQYPDVARAFGENAQKRAFSAFNIDHMMREYFELYRK